MSVRMTVRSKWVGEADYCFPVLKVMCSLLRLVLFWTRLLVSILLENPVQNKGSQSGQLLASSSLSSWSLCFLPLELLSS